MACGDEEQEENTPETPVTVGDATLTKAGELRGSDALVSVAQSCCRCPLLVTVRISTPVQRVPGWYHLPEKGRIS